MANLGHQDGIFHVRFRYAGKEFKKSLKIRERSEAEAARCLVEVTIHRLRTGQIKVPDGVDFGEFIASGDTLEAPPPAKPAPAPAVLPSTRQLTEEYGVSVKDVLALSYHYSQTHGPWISHSMYLVQGGVLLVGAYLIYSICLRGKAISAAAVELAPLPAGAQIAAVQATSLARAGEPQLEIRPRVIALILQRYFS